MAAKRLADIASAEWSDEREKRHEHAVPEWGGVTVYWKAWTMADDDAVFGPTGPKTLNARLARIIVIKAQDAEGKPLFVLPEEDQLLAEARPEVVARLGNAIFKTMPKADDQAVAAKN